MLSFAKEKAVFFLMHLSCSIILLALPLTVLTFFYFPAHLFWTDGGKEVITIALLIDVVLGPVLGAIVYKKGKKTLKMDLAFIVVVQVAAAGYGFHAMFETRPVAQVVVRSVAWTVTANQLESAPSKEASALLGHGKVPVMRFEYGLTGKDLVKDVESYTVRQRGVFVDAKRWRPMSLAAEAEVYPLSKLKEEDRRKVEAALARAKGNGVKTPMVFAFGGRFKNGLIIVDGTSGILSDFVDVDPGPLVLL